MLDHRRVIVFLARPALGRPEPGPLGSLVCSSGPSNTVVSSRARFGAGADGGSGAGVGVGGAVGATAVAASLGIIIQAPQAGHLPRMPAYLILT
jgi:hypothetical protein